MEPAPSGGDLMDKPWPGIAASRRRIARATRLLDEMGYHWESGNDRDKPNTIEQ